MSDAPNRFGDVARDMVQDKGLNGRMSYATVVKRLEAMGGVSPAVFDVLEELNRLYEVKKISVALESAQGAVERAEKRALEYLQRGSAAN